jgi:MFS family permease
LLASTAVSSVGDGALAAALPLLAAYLTRDPVGVAAVSAASGLPWFLVGPFAGVWVDRLPRRLVLVVADVLRAAALAVLVGLLLTDAASIPALCVVAFLLVSGQTFFDSAVQAVIPHVVGRDQAALGKANGRLYSTQTVGSSLAGPPLGGTLFGLAPWLPFALDAASFAASAGFVAALPASPAPAGGRRSGVLSSLAEGFRYLFRARRLLTLAVGLTIYNVAFNLANATLVLFAQEHLGVTDAGFGAMLAAMSVGAILIGLRSGWLLQRLGVAGAVVGSVLGQAAAWAGVAFSSTPWLAGAALAVAGATSTLVTVAVVSERQSTVPDELIGRVTSAFRLIGNGFAPLGGLAGGLIAASVNLRAPLLTACGVLVIAGASLAVVLKAAVRH